MSSTRSACTLAAAITLTVTSLLVVPAMTASADAATVPPTAGTGPVLPSPADVLRTAAADAAVRQAAAPPALAPAPAPVWRWPVETAVTSGFGPRTHPITGAARQHAGVDLPAPTGTPIAAAADGTVVSAGWQGGYGTTVVIDHGGGTATLYAHQSAISVVEGQVVTAGEVIGAVGTTGASTGPHLHLEVRVDGTPVDPAPYLPTGASGPEAARA